MFLGDTIIAALSSPVLGSWKGLPPEPAGLKIPACYDEDVGLGANAECLRA